MTTNEITTALHSIRAECEAVIALSKQDNIVCQGSDSPFISASRTLLPKTARATIVLVEMLEGMLKSNIMEVLRHAELHAGKLIHDWNKP